ncbi:DUF4249 family protein [Candidatus Marinimicrobia bacterium MT.SAG.3]|nr:DUF4249 family protein [Candidatus Marinimicrobia bacterium MT.SAG.3]
MSRKNIMVLIILLTSSIGLLSCESIIDLPDPVKFEEKIVLNGNLVLGSSNVLIRLDVATAIEENFDSLSTALSGAIVILKYDSTELTLAETTPGKYEYSDNSFRITPGKSYTIEASYNDLTTISATTIVPYPIKIIEMSPIINSGDSLTYIPASDTAQFLDPYLFSFKVKSTVDGEFPSIIRLVNRALEPSKETMITEDNELKAFLFKWNGIGDDSDEDINRRIHTRNRIIFNSVDPDAEYKMGWIYYTFYGWQSFEVYALDRAYYNYHIRNIEDAPTDPNYLPESNVIGGYGLLFSSYRVKIDFFLKRP